jgi:hypothetical protein
MLKVLLETTALVAMSVTAAQADVSISGYSNFEVTDDGTTTSFYQDGEVKVTGTSTTDSGLTMSAVYAMSTSTGSGLGDGGASGAGEGIVDDSYINLSGDFGNLRMGNTDDALDLNDGLVPANWDENGNGGPVIGGKQGEGNETISFTAPTISGIKVYGSTTAEGAYTGMGVNYSNGPVSVMYQMGEDGTASEKLAAVNFTMAGVTVGFSTFDSEDGATKEEASSMGVKYSMGDLDLYYVSQKDTKAGKTENSLGGYYSIAPGLQAALETADNGLGANTTYAHLKVSF